MVLGFSHVQLVVRDVAASAQWYATVLGVEQFVGGQLASGPYAGLRHPSAGFVIGMQTATSDERAALSSSMIEHLSFHVTDRDALLAAHERLTHAGIAVGDIFDEAVSHNLRLRDPDGLVVELTAPKARAR